MISEKPFRQKQLRARFPESILHFPTENIYADRSIYFSSGRIGFVI